MPKRKGYWVIEIEGEQKTIFRQQLPGHMSNSEIATILQRLAARELSVREVVAASIRKPRRTTLLEVRVDGPPNGKRAMIWIPALSNYTASYWRHDEINERPEILAV